MPIRVLQLVASNFFGGPERQILSHARAVCSARVRCIVGGFQEGGRQNELLHRASALGLDTLAVVAQHVWNPSQIRYLTQYLAEEQIDVLCTHGYRATAIGLPSARGARVPLIAFPRGWTAENLKTRLYQLLGGGFLLRYADAVVAVSHAQAQDVTSRFRVPRSKVFVVHNAVDVSALDCEMAGCASIRGEFAIPLTAPLVVSIGRLSPEKGHRFLVTAAGQVLTRHAETRFILVGDGVERPHLERQVSRLGLRERVLFAGLRRDVPRFLKDADLVLLPSLTEGLSNVLLEAAAAGRACIAAAVGGTPEVVEDGVSGLLVPPGDPAALAEAVSVCLGDDARRRSLGERARAIVEARFRFDDQARWLEAIYMWCVAQGAQRSRQTWVPAEAERPRHGDSPGRASAGPRQ